MQGNDLRPTRLERVGAVVAGLLAVALLVAACGGTSGSSSSGGSSKKGALAYSQCMRSHGVRNFPDPDSQGRLQLKTGNGFDPSSPQFQAAQKACQSLQPAPSADQQKKDRDQALKYAKCMRSHGIPDFPDPDAQGRMQIQVSPGSDLEPNSPLYQAAVKACRQYQPGGGQSTTSQQGGGS